MKNFFKELFEYNLTANENYLLFLLENETRLSEKTVKLINHILNAHQIWNNRIEHQEASYMVWEIHKFADLSLIDKINHELSLEIIAKHGFEKIIAYHNSQGLSLENSVRDILFHVINHSNYHRAQIASELVALGLKPPISDYIFYKRFKWLTKSFILDKWN